MGRNASISTRRYEEKEAQQKQRTSITCRSTGLYRDNSYSSSLLGFCLNFFFVSLSFGPYTHASTPYISHLLLSSPKGTKEKIPTRLIRIPKCTNAFTASWSGIDSLACWYSRLRSSSGTPSRCWMYSDMIRTFLLFLYIPIHEFAVGYTVTRHPLAQ